MAVPCSIAPQLRLQRRDLAVADSRLHGDRSQTLRFEHVNRFFVVGRCVHVPEKSVIVIKSLPVGSVKNFHRYVLHGVSNTSDASLEISRQGGDGAGVPAGAERLETIV